MSDEPVMFGRDWHMGERVVYRPFICACCQSERSIAQYTEEQQPLDIWLSVLDSH